MRGASFANVDWRWAPRVVVVTAVAAATGISGQVAQAAEAKEQPASGSYAVVAQSGEHTAATGRLPISARIARARKPIQRIEPEPEPVVIKPVPRVPFPEAEALVEAAGQATTEPTHDEQAGPSTDAAAGTAVTSDVTAETPAVDVANAGESVSADAGTTATDEPATLPAHDQTADDSATPGRLQPGFSYPLSVLWPFTSAEERAAILAGPARRHEEPGRLAVEEPRVTLEVTESQPLATRGTPIEWRLRLCNTGGEPAREVAAMLFFAEGIEPVAASGQMASLAAGEVRFHPLESLGPGETVELVVTGVATEPGSVAYRAEVLSGDLPEAVASEGEVQVTDGRPEIRQ